MSRSVRRESLRGRIKIYAGSAPSAIRLNSSGRLPYVKVDDLNIGSKYQVASREYAESAPIVVPKGAVLFPKRGAAIANNKVRIAALDVCLDTNVMGVETLGDLDTEYFYYAITHEKLYKIADTSTIPQLNNKHLYKCRIWIPSVKIQQQISRALAALDRIIGEIGGLLDAKREFKRGLAQQLLTGQKRFPKFRSSKWVTSTIGDLFEEVERPVEWSDESEYRLVSIRRRSGGMFLREVKRGGEIKTKMMFVVREGDIVISRMQVVHGALAIVPSDLDGCHVSGTYFVLVPKKGAVIEPDFFNYLSQLPRMYHAALVSSYGVHIEKMTFNPEWYLQTKIRIPSSIEEQKHIVETLRLADAELALLEAQRENYAQYKRGLLACLLSGELPVAP